ncbi:MAG: tripartite tricarboxylate transporter substrate binding protein [Burkholderiales bacterium]|nr:tripartite tricarboxylate transporter substrate binding protein [Burkholderiales bacterium]
MQILKAAAIMLALATMAPITTLAQPWPSRPIRIIIPFAPAGPADLIGRPTGQKLSEILGQPVVIDNRAGAGGNVGAQAVAKSAPDGYTLLVTTTAYAVNVTLSPNPGFDAERELVPVAVIARQPNLIYVNPSVAARTLTDLLALARTQKLAFASPGSGTTPHLTAENFFNVSHKLDVTAIHFRGAGPAMTAVMGGEPLVGSGALSAPLPHVKAGKLRGVAVSSAARVAALPDVPTFAEAGFPGVNDDTWIALFAPTGTPAPVIQRLNEAVNQMLGAPDMRERLGSMAFDPVGGTQRAFADYVRAEVAKWGKVVREGNIKAE